MKDIDFKSSNHLQFIPLLKGLRFLTEDGTPTDRYRQFLDGSRWEKVIAEAVKESYSDIFVIKARPTGADLQMIIGKFKSTYNLSDISADRAARTFLALLNLSDTDTLYSSQISSEASPVASASSPMPTTSTLLPKNESQAETVSKSNLKSIGLNYNIQIHLPATKDAEVYNAIFKSLREHVID